MPGAATHAGGRTGSREAGRTGLKPFPHAESICNLSGLYAEARIETRKKLSAGGGTPAKILVS